MGPSRVYNPLNGVEVKTLILREIEAAFAEVSDFREMVTFPVVRWNWKCTISCYPREPQDIPLQKIGAHIATDATPEEMTSTQDVGLQGQNAVGAPGMTPADQAREEAGLPVPKLKFDKMGGAYDEMVRKDKPKDEWTPPGVRGAVIDAGPGRVSKKK